MEFKTLLHPLLYNMIKQPLWMLMMAAAVIIAVTVIIVMKELKKK